MMPNIAFKALNTLSILFLRTFGSNLNKLLLRVSDEYYSLLSQGVLHDTAIVRIMKNVYIDDKKKIDDCNYFVFSRKQSIDSIYDQKYGKSGRFMSHLFKLIQKIYLDKYLDDNRLSYDEELNNSMVMLNKNFNKVVLYMFSKYDK